MGWVLGAVGLPSHVPRTWLGGHHHKPEIIVVCASQGQSLVTEQGEIWSWHYCIQPGADEDTKLGAEWEGHSGEIICEESQRS